MVKLNYSPVRVRCTFHGNAETAAAYLPEGQLSLWERLSTTPKYFVLYYIFGMKCATIPQRNELKDYLDIHALIVEGKLDLATGIACAVAIYGRQYNPVLTLQALSYFEDLPASLPDR